MIEYEDHGLVIALKCKTCNKISYPNRHKGVKGYDGGFGK